VFTVTVVLSSFAVAAIAYSERRHKEHWTVRVGLLPPTPVAGYDLWGWQVSTGQAVALGLIACNVGVHLVWGFSRAGGRTATNLKRFLDRNFMHFPFSGRAFPLLGSTFSHVDWLHLGVNMVALWSFAPLMVSVLGPETFLAAYVSSGCITSLGGMLIHVAKNVHSPSCGASGALLSLFASSALLFPHAKFSIIFFPFASFTGPQLLLAAICVDLCGVAMGWRMFHHGAHLAGSLLGIAFVNGGAKAAHSYQVWAIERWREAKRTLGWR